MTVTVKSTRESGVRRSCRADSISAVPGCVDGDVCVQIVISVCRHFCEIRGAVNSSARYGVACVDLADIRRRDARSKNGCYHRNGENKAEQFLHEIYSPFKIVLYFRIRLPTYRVLSLSYGKPMHYKASYYINFDIYCEWRKQRDMDFSKMFFRFFLIFLLF